MAVGSFFLATCICGKNQELAVLIIAVCICCAALVIIVLIHIPFDRVISAMNGLYKEMLAKGELSPEKCVSMKGKEMIQVRSYHVCYFLPFKAQHLLEKCRR